MANFLDDSLGSPLDYDSEVAYITMTSPVGDQAAQQSHDDVDDEFDFSLTLPSKQKDSEEEDDNHTENNSDKERPPPQGNKAPSPKKKNPPRLSRLSIPGREVELGEIKETSPASEVSNDRKQSLSPLSLDGVPHFTLDTEGPHTPRSQLRRIKMANDRATSPSPSPKPKLNTSQHMYCTLVVYGSSGCGRTHLVNKLVQSNPPIFAKVISSTTRKRRTHEVNGVDFHFISHKEMSRRIAQGDFMEHITISRKRRETAPLQRQVLVQNRSMGALASQEQRSRTVSTTASDSKLLSSSEDKPVIKPLEKLMLGAGKQYDSAFELRDEDSPVAGGEIFGTSHQALSEAVQQGKPCILLNVSSRSAQLLASSGLEGSFVLIQSGTARKDKPPRVGGGLQPQHTISAVSLDQAYSNLHDYSFQLVSKLNLPLTSNYEAAKYEWESLPTISFDQAGSGPSLKQAADVTFSELLAHFQAPGMKKHMQRARSEFTKPKKFSRAKLSKKLLEERHLVQATSYCAISDKDSLHLRTLQTIYSKLTGNVLQCRRFSPHWLEVGFSGVDPADDLQEVGLLGPAQLIYFLDNPRTAQICKEIYQHCHIKETQGTPFCALSFTFTKFAQDVLEDGVLNKVCNKQDQVFAVVNDFYMASFHHYYHAWRASRKSLLELGLLQHTCQDYCRSHAVQILKEFAELVDARAPQSKGFSEVPKTELLFTPMTMNDTTNS